MRRIVIVCLLASLAWATTASAAPLWYENFEQTELAPEWTLWTQRGTNSSTSAAESPVLGDPLHTDPDAPNERYAVVQGTNCNVGIWTVVTDLPIGETLTIDGYWRELDFDNSWCEVIVIDNEADFPDQVTGDVTGPLEYKTDSWGAGGPGAAGGLISDTAEITNDGDFTTTDGQVAVLLKVGNNDDSLVSVAFDDMFITPEPATALLLGLPMLALLRRRR